ncbi:hypothetical protein G7046_g2548 [Stylonectria norvegica]|nr:hypothetical protein G7046_g2548 [Stylonectria norvegica]
MYPAFGRHPQYPNPRFAAQTCAAPGTFCRNRVVRLSVDGEIASSLFCKFHACSKIDGGRLCRRAKLPSAAVCSDHMKCAEIVNGMRCPWNVKDGDPRMYQYCSNRKLHSLQNSRDPLLTPSFETYASKPAVQTPVYGNSERTYNYATTTAVGTRAAEAEGIPAHTAENTHARTHIAHPSYWEKKAPANGSGSATGTVSAKAANADASATPVATASQRRTAAPISARRRIAIKNGAMGLIAVTIPVLNRCAPGGSSHPRAGSTVHITNVVSRVARLKLLQTGIVRSIRGARRMGARERGLSQEMGPALPAKTIPLLSSTFARVEMVGLTATDAPKQTRNIVRGTSAISANARTRRNVHPIIASATNATTPSAAAQESTLPMGHPCRRLEPTSSSSATSTPVPSRSAGTASSQGRPGARSTLAADLKVVGSKWTAGARMRRFVGIISRGGLRGEGGWGGPGGGQGWTGWGRDCRQFADPWAAWGVKM